MLKTSGSSNTGAQRSKTKSPARILIVENEAIVRYDIRLQLEALGYSSSTLFFRIPGFPALAYQ
ncbi:response regulator [Rhodoferax antarcticus]|uniref:hypothetical protein n=1 Tax=Rhodoferax antarcticus TaxID=81479 RepID=UPI002225171C|nr:hypothetical protein [Rhodoferax antarcticus]MCW2314151.1 hypothetical protein [Rhodoferax antarcticus]